MPYTGIVLTIIGLHAALFLILLGHWLVAAGIAPRATQAFVEQYETRPVRALLVGVFTYGPLFIGALAASNAPAPLLKLAALIASYILLLIALAGLAGLAARIGRNLTPGGSPWQQSLRGGVMLALVCITPFVGWGFLLHIALASGFGAFLLAKPWKCAVTAVAV